MPDDSADMIRKATDAAAAVVHDAKNTAQALLATAERTAQGLTGSANNPPYTNRELDEKFRNLADKLDTHHRDLSEDLAKVLEQTTKTNGSVAAIKGNQKWLSGLTYGLGACLIAIIIPVIGYLALTTIGNSTQLAALKTAVHTLTK